MTTNIDNKSHVKSPCSLIPFRDRHMFVAALVIMDYGQCLLAIGESLVNAGAEIRTCWKMPGRGSGGH